jgi:hypothetical protein
MIHGQLLDAVALDQVGAAVTDPGDDRQLYFPPGDN